MGGGGGGGGGGGRFVFFACRSARARMARRLISSVSGRIMARTEGGVMMRCWRGGEGGGG